MLKVFLCAALSAGLLFAVCWVHRKLFLPLAGPGLYAVLMAAGDGSGLEPRVRAYCVLRSWGLLRAPLLLADAGLSAEGRALAAKLCGLDGQIRFCRAEALPEILDNAASRNAE